MSLKKIAIIGGGFSGLTIAWALTKKNIAVEVFEAGPGWGGMLSTRKIVAVGEEILVESAANALLASQNVESLLNDIGVTPITAGYKSKSRWIFRNNKPNKFPLSFFEAFEGVSNIIVAKLSDSLKANSNETLADWGSRVLSQKFTDYLVSPAFQGVYGATGDKLSAELIINSLLDKSLKPKRGLLKGSISASEGMGEIIKAIVNFLKKNQVKLHVNSPVKLQDILNNFDAVIVATSLRSAEEQLKTLAPKASVELAKVPTVALTSATVVFNSQRTLKGFGCLFPKDQGFNSLGVLFNSDIFKNRAPRNLESETWILSEPNASDEEVKKIVLADRLKLTEQKATQYSQQSEPQAIYVKQWPKALPLYGSALQDVLQGGEFAQGLKLGNRLSEISHPVYLTGNYLGAIGLSRILDYNLRLADRIEKEIK